MVKTTVYNANNPADIAAVETWLGRDLDAIQVHGGSANWSDWLGSVGWQGNLYKGQSVDIMWSIPLIPSGANLADAAAGKYDANYLAMAKQLVANAATDNDTGQIYVRLGWEMNTSGWNPWGAVGQADNYVKAFQDFVTIARSVSDKFVFEWTPNVGNQGMNPADAYPGDDYVDVIGSDFYYNTQWDSKNGAQAFNWIVNEQYGLQWQQDFATAHGKPTAIAEWGLNSDNPDFVKLVAKWADDHNMLYQNYWDSNAGFQGELSNGQYAAAGAAFKATFGAEPATGPVVVDTGSSASTYAPYAGIGPATAGDDVLHGSAKLTDLRGGDGNDTYYITAANQKITEYYHDGHGGKDLVISTINYALGGNVENLTLAGSGNINGTGNDMNNILTGNAGNNVLTGNGGNDKIYGGAGNDTLVGGSGNDHMEGGAGNDTLIGNGGADDLVGGDGNDTYYVDNAAQRVVEYYSSGKGGYDIVHSSIDYTMGDFIEELHLDGTANLNATGNSAANTIYGNAGDNRIDGGLGADKLYGGGGNDTFVVGLNSGKKVIGDFGTGDTLDVSAYLAAHHNATVTRSGADTLITFDKNDTIKLIGVTPDHLHATASGYIFG